MKQWNYNEDDTNILHVAIRFHKKKKQRAFHKSFSARVYSNLQKLTCVQIVYFKIISTEMRLISNERQIFINRQVYTEMTMTLDVHSLSW